METAWELNSVMQFSRINSEVATSVYSIQHQTKIRDIACHPKILIASFVSDRERKVMAMAQISVRMGYFVWQQNPILLISTFVCQT